MSNFQIEHFLPGSRCSLRDALHGAGPERERLAARTLAADSIHRSMEKGLRPKAGAEAGTSLTAPCGGQPSAADLDFFGERAVHSDNGTKSHRHIGLPGMPLKSWSPSLPGPAVSFTPERVPTQALVGK